MPEFTRMSKTDKNCAAYWERGHGHLSTDDFKYLARKVCVSLAEPFNS